MSWNNRSQNVFRTIAGKVVSRNGVGRITIGLWLFLISPFALAAETTPWKTYLFIVMGISLIAGSVLSFRNPKAESRMAKLLLTGLYFWVFTFAQLIILALIYYFNK